MKRSAWAEGAVLNALKTVKAEECFNALVSLDVYALRDGSQIIRIRLIQISFFGLLMRHLSLQYFTSSHTFSHFLRQVNGRLQTVQIFVGRFCFLCIMAGL